MAAIGSFINKTLTAIEGHTVETDHRPYLGMSKIGHSCNRYLWYSFRWAYKEELTPRQIRLFNRGHREEEQVVKMLESVGIECWGDQDEVVMAFGHCKGHRDGACRGVLEAPKTDHLLEIKTMNDKNYKDLVKSKEVRMAKPIYYAQTQIYMRRFCLTRALFVAVNKNDDSIYIERVKLDPGFADDLERKAESIILSEGPPEKQFHSSWYECKWCPARGICHLNVDPLKNCRTCSNIDILQNGGWECGLSGKTLSTDDQRVGCDEYSINVLMLQ